MNIFQKLILILHNTLNDKTLSFQQTHTHTHRCHCQRQPIKLIDLKV